ncbi:MAG: hypothetical protein FWB86_08115 [Treponema sp.]|nr:hypothetical protein [Treponema sp.]MCL2251948.1 hypothetical protein [Treponema sp.]
MKKVNDFWNQQKAVIIAFAVVFALSLGNCATLGGIFDTSSSSSNKAADVNDVQAAQNAINEEYTAARRAAYPQSLTPDTGVIPYIIMRAGTVGYSLRRDDKDIAVTGSTIVLQNFIDAIRTDANGANCTIQFGDGRTPLTTPNDEVTFSGRWGTITLTGFFTSYATKNNSAITISGAINVINYARLRYESTVSGNISMMNNSGTGTLTIEGGILEAKGKSPTSVLTNSSTGTIIVKNGYFEAEGVGIRNTAAGKIIIEGGWVDAFNQFAICNEGAGTVTINNGYSSVWNEGTGTVTVNGGTTELAVINGTGTINGGNISRAACFVMRNTAPKRPVITINGGLFRVFRDDSLYLASDGRIILSGDPEINNMIHIEKFEGKTGTLSLSASFAPSANRRYTLLADIRDGSSPDGFLMVENGAAFIDRFDLRGYNDVENYKLGIRGNNIVLQPK